MATKKKSAEDEWTPRSAYDRLKSEAEARPLVAISYTVYEVCPPYDDWDDRYWPSKSRKVAGGFDSRTYEDPESSVDAWVEDHDPDPWDGRPTTFSIQKRYLRTYVEDRWGPL